ncbi:MAG: FHA domain-containing protein [Polyangiaceae bacterium]|jgi:pSer/pThr/pTyr-binding forkhead associated (FHA) protein
MPISVLVRSATGGDARLTFDGMQSVVLGRGASCDVRLPDASVSHRHASLRTQGMDFVLIDEGSSNGTYVGGVRVAPRTSRIVRSGDVVRLGRVWIELRIDQSPVTRDLGSATREVALALVSQALAAMGTDLTMKVRVLEGRDQGLVLALREEGRAYTLGRGPECDLPIADGDASREHATLVRRGTEVRVRDLGAKNGTWLGDAPLPADRDAVWRPALMLRIGRTVLALEEPVGDALARIEVGPDERMPDGEAVPAPEPSSPVVEAPASAAREPASAAPMSAAPMVEIPVRPAPPRERPRSGWAPADLMVMAAAIGVLALSIAGLIYLLRG